VTAEGAADEIISSDGEVIATMKNGTEYVLRFGNLTSVDGGGQDGEQPVDAEAAAAKSEDGDVNRYLFVMARFNENAVKQPELQPLPELPAKEAAGEGAEAADAPAAAADREDASGDAAADAGEAETEEVAVAAEEASASEEAKTEEAGAASDEEKDKELEKVIAERQRIEQENQRKLDEYQASLKKGRENVKDLNLRFGDWYFVVDDKVFGKIRLSLDDVTKKKEQPATDAASTEGASEPAVPSGVPGLSAIPGVNE
jgi:hypothetical protein